MLAAKRSFDGLDLRFAPAFHHIACRRMLLGTKRPYAGDDLRLCQHFARRRRLSQCIVLRKKSVDSRIDLFSINQQNAAAVPKTHQERCQTLPLLSNAKYTGKLPYADIVSVVLLRRYLRRKRLFVGLETVWSDGADVG